jgi:hypothetical protein
MSVSGVHRVAGRLADVLRRDEIRIAAAQVDYVSSLGFELAGLLRYGEGR